MYWSCSFLSEVADFYFLGNIINSTIYLWSNSGLDGTVRMFNLNQILN